MTVYVDTSAFLALLNADDEFHFKASSIWSDLLASNIRLVTNSFVLVETYALVQNRLGLDAVRTVAQDIIPLFEIHWIDNDLYQPAITACLSANRRYLSLVDCSSFITMLRSKITKVFTFDSHFAEQGFELIGLFNTDTPPPEY